jgi:hypothetical protein
VKRARIDKRRSAWIFGAAAVVVVLGEVAFLTWRAREPDPKYPALAADIMRRVDLDADGRVSADEYQQFALSDEPMTPWDLDGDEALSLYELENQFLSTDPTKLMMRRARMVMGDRAGFDRPPPQ